MKILMVSAEIAELAAVGGLAEYTLGLASALLHKGHDVRVAVPSYAFLRSLADRSVLDERLVVQLGVGMSEVTSVQEVRVACPGGGCPNLPVIMLGEHKHFASMRTPTDIYRWPNHEPWIAFSRAAVDFLDSSEWHADVIHCQDAHTALVPVYLRQFREQQASRPLSAARTVLTIHNLLNQGIGAAEIVAYVGLPAHLFHGAGFEYFGSANSLKAGLLAADRVSTVSRTYAQEICEGREYGFGLEGVLRGLRDTGRLRGIVNGIDSNRWRMEGLHYDGTDHLDDILRRKQASRQRLYAKWGWRGTEEPVFGFRGRWDNQKGISTLGECLEQILDRVRLVVAVWGLEGADVELLSLWQAFKQMSEERPDRLLINPEGICAAADVADHYSMLDCLLMPSRYEPCGLMQMECQRYGTIPIVRHTGGLADTVSESRTPEWPSPNGFVFREPSTEALLGAVDRAAEAFRDRNIWGRLIQNALLQQNSWGTRVGQYEQLLG